VNRPAFIRKLVYLAVIAALLIPLARLSQPSTAAMPGRPASAGGVLAQKRQEFKLGQANLGKIDPASETLRLASFGLRGIAANILWNKAEEYKIKKDWTRLSAAYQQIAYLQPNFVNVWRFQAWNLSYNISHEFDDYHDKYRWVIKGLDFLEEGLDYNEGEPRLLQFVGWFARHKMGRSDERRQYRKLFHDDDDFHKRQRVHERDNFLFAREYYREAEDAVANPRDERILQVAMSPTVFFMQSSMAQMEYAQALEDDHAEALAAATQRSDDVSRHAIEDRLRSIDRDFQAKILAAWSDAARRWTQYGQRPFLSQDGQPYRLADLEVYDNELKQVVDQLDVLAPGAREKLQIEKLAKLEPAERRAYETSAFERSKEQNELAQRAMLKLHVTHGEVAERAEKDRQRARELGERAMKLQTLCDQVRNDRMYGEFDYWTARCRLEQTPQAREARRLMHHATVAFHDANLLQARDDYIKSFAMWADVVRDNPEIQDDPATQAMDEAIHRYESTLKQLDEPFPTDFVLDRLRTKG
jgi:hypothetical protein